MASPDRTFIVWHMGYVMASLGWNGSRVASVALAWRLGTAPHWGPEACSLASACIVRLYRAEALDDLGRVASPSALRWSCL